MKTNKQTIQQCCFHFVHSSVVARRANNKLAGTGLFELTVEKIQAANTPLFHLQCWFVRLKGGHCSALSLPLRPLHIARTESNACALNAGRKKEREAKGEERGDGVNGWRGGKVRVHSWRCSTLTEREREREKEEFNTSARHEGWHSVWRRRGGSFPHFKPALSILSHLPPSLPARSVLAKV